MTTSPAGRHVEIRLIGAPSHIDATLKALSQVLSVTRGTRRPTRDHDGRVIQYLTATAPDTRKETDRA